MPQWIARDPLAQQAVDRIARVDRIVSALTGKGPQRCLVCDSMIPTFGAWFSEDCNTGDIGHTLEPGAEWNLPMGVQP